MRSLLIFLLFLTYTSLAMAFTGFYKTIDDKTQKPKSIVSIYKYKESTGEERLAGRIIALYNENGTISETINNPKIKATEVPGMPNIAGLDIVWGMQYNVNSNRYENGSIMDPKSGKIYNSVMWQEKEDLTKLYVRGKIGPFGRTQVWSLLKISDLPTELQNINTLKWQPQTK